MECLASFFFLLDYFVAGISSVIILFFIGNSCCLPAGQAGLLAAGRFAINHSFICQILLGSVHIYKLYTKDISF